MTTPILITHFQKNSIPLEIIIDNIKYSEILNYSIGIDYKMIDNFFSWSEEHIQEIENVIQYYETKRYDNYSFWWSKGLPKCIVELFKNRNSRRAVIQFLGNKLSPSCLTSVQFLIRNNKLNVIANYRSWELEEYGPYDVLLIKRFAEELSKHLGNMEIDSLFFNAGSAHIKV